MNLADPMQKFQDWFTQQWVILTGKRIIPKNEAWLMGPFGNLEGIGETFITELAAKENLIIQRNSKDQGLITSINQLNLSIVELQRLSIEIVSFYECTSNYDLEFAVKWNPVFKLLGALTNRLFSRRINQLNIPINNLNDATSLKSEIITLLEAQNLSVKYTIWLRKIESTNQVIYSGVYGTSILPSGDTCIKAVFPLPNGNATVIMKPSVNAQGSLVLDSSGKKFGDAGFYFLLKNAKGKFWAKYIRAFRDQLIVNHQDSQIIAEQTLTLWQLIVLKFKYKIT